MDNASPVAALRVANEAFLVASMIERCPKTMMIRELVVNALEAAQRGPQPGEVRISASSMDGANKLTIMNSGLGLTAEQLYAICDLASSINKEQGLDANFGMGAKVASLPSNRHGLRYRSCRAGRVSEVIMGQREGIYGRILQDGQEVRDVTAACANSPYGLDEDWTEVVLMGNRPGQITVIDPFDGNPHMPLDWLVADLSMRFFRLPPGLALHIAPEASPTRRELRLRCFDERRADYGRTETVTTPSGVKIHYYYDPAEGQTTRSARNADFAHGSFGAIVYKSEIYGLCQGEHWQHDGPSYGITFGAKYISAFVELPDDYPVRPEAYRQFLRFRGGDQRQVAINDLSHLIRNNIPDWLAEIIRSLGPATVDLNRDLASELMALLDELDVPPMPGEALPLPDAPEAAQQRQESQPPPATALPPAKPRLRPPEIISLDSEELLAERDMVGRAAKYYPASNQIFLNLLYPSLTALTDALTKLDTRPDTPEHRAEATALARQTMARRIARTVVFSLSKRKQGWTIQQITQAQSPEALSLLVDDWVSLLPAARSEQQAHHYARAA